MAVENGKIASGELKDTDKVVVDSFAALSPNDFDDTPTAGSNKLMTSGAIKEALEEASEPSDYAQVKAQVQQNTQDIAGIEDKIPAQASAQNQLADKAFVNSSIATNTATFRGTYNLVSDLGLTTSATEQAVASAIATHLAALVPPVVPENNDYCFVQVPRETSDPTVIDRIDRYKCTVTESGGVTTRAWEYEWSLNNSSFTAAQWAAINSGITSALVTKLGALPTADELAAALLGKADKVANATSGNLAGLDGNGNLMDSGKKPTDFAPATNIAKTALASDVQTSLGKADTAIQGVKKGGTTLTPDASKVVDIPDETRVAAYALPDDCFPITYEELIDTTYVERTIADNDGIRFENSGDAIVLHDIASEAEGGYDYGFGSFSASTLKWDSSDAPIGNLKFNNTAPTANTWPILEKDAVYVRDVQVAKEADVAAKLALKANDSEVLKNSGNQTLMGTLKALGAGGLVETLNSSMNEVGVRAYNGSSYAVKYLADGIYVSTDGEATYTKLSLPNVAGTLALVSQIYAAVQQIAPAWVSGTTYAADALVSYNGAIYARRTSGSITSSTNPASDTTNWEAKRVTDLFLPLTGGTMTGQLALRNRLYIRNANLDSGCGLEITRDDTESSGGWRIYEDSNYGLSMVLGGRWNYITFRRRATDSTSDTVAYLHDFAPEYSASKTYEVGSLAVRTEFVTGIDNEYYYKATLYRCTTAITTAEAWTAAHWTEATVEDVLAAIRTALADKAPLVSPAFTGTPTAPDMDAQSTDGQVANKKYVDEQVAGATPSDYNAVKAQVAANAQKLEVWLSVNPQTGVVSANYDDGQSAE